MPSTTTGSSGPRRQTRVSTPYSRRRSTRRTRPPTPASRARIAAYSPPPSQASVIELQPSPKRQACHGCMREFTIDSTWRQDSRWAAGLPPSRLRRTSTRSPRAPSKRRLAATRNPVRPALAAAGRAGLRVAARRRLLGARGDLVEVRRKREGGSPAAQRESCLHVESIVNSRIQPRQACLLGAGCNSITLAWEGGGEYAAIRAREAGVGGRVRRVLRRREHGYDPRVRLRGPDEPVVVLRIEASDERVEGCRAHKEHDPRGLRVRAVVRNDQLARDSHEGSLGPRRLVHVPVVRDVDLLLSPVDRDLIDLGQRRVESSASKCGWRRRPQLILGGEKEGTRAEVAACD